MVLAFEPPQSSLTSCLSSLIVLASSLVVPGHFPASKSACLHHPRRVSALTPTLLPIRTTAAFKDSSRSSALAPVTRRRARSRNSCGYFLGAGMSSSFRGIRPSPRPGPVHNQQET